MAPSVRASFHFAKTVCEFVPNLKDSNFNVIIFTGRLSSKTCEIIQVDNTRWLGNGYRVLVVSPPRIQARF
jgi:hypothetical protein